MLKEINIAQLKAGMYIHKFLGSWVEHPFWRARFKVESTEDLEKIRRSTIATLIIDISKGADADPAPLPDVEAHDCEHVPEDSAATDATAPKRNGAGNKAMCSLDDEILRAAKICNQAKQAVASMFCDARMGKALSIVDAGVLVTEISESVLRHPQALISLSRLKTANEYTYMHSVAVCALMIALARTLGLEEAQVHEAGIAGLMHDIGKVLIPDSILDKPGKLSKEEYVAVQAHPRLGAGILYGQHQISAAVIDVCLHHHEKVDGSGYPEGLAGQEISLLARMGAICDVYDAVTSNRPYKAGWEPAHAIREMASWQGHFDAVLFQAFIKTVGIYPIGALVSLGSGRLGVVVEHTAKSLLRPKVKVFLSTRSRLPIPVTVVDLSKFLERDKIIRIETPSDWGVKNLAEIWSGIPNPLQSSC